MSLAVLFNTQALAINLSASFGASGGTAPYTFSVVPGGAGGVINSSTGIYTAPSAPGIDTIQVTDSASPTPATATLPVLVGSALELMLDVIRNQMGLGTDQIWIWNQKTFIPKDSRTYVVLSILSTKTFGNSYQMDTADAGCTAKGGVNVMALVSIDILSRSASVVDQKEQLLLALSSVYSQQQQQMNAFQISQVPVSLVDASERDGAAIVYRFNINVNLMYFVPRTVAVPYFSTFPAAQVTPNP